MNTISSFTISHKLISIIQSISILVSPSLNQRVRYENECEKTLRYVTVPNNGTITIGVCHIFLLEKIFLVSKFN
jgi:hypothetical protein